MLRGQWRQRNGQKDKSGREREKERERERESEEERERESKRKALRAQWRFKNVSLAARIEVFTRWIITFNENKRPPRRTPLLFCRTRTGIHVQTHSQPEKFAAKSMLFDHQTAVHHQRSLKYGALSMNYINDMVTLFIIVYLLGS